MEEIWKAVPINFGNYELSTNGKLRNKDTKKELKFHVTDYGYLRVNIMQDGERSKVFLHKLMALTFIDNPENKKYVNHKDGNKLNNSIDNLEWATASENNIHALRTGLRSSKNRVMMKKEDVNLIKYLAKRTNLLQKTIAELFSLSPKKVSYIVSTIDF